MTKTNKIKQITLEKLMAWTKSKTKIKIAAYQCKEITISVNILIIKVIQDIKQIIVNQLRVISK